MRILKPTLVSLLITISCVSFYAQQIPNGGFEEWSIPNTWTETPDGWTTQNGQLIQNTVRDSFPNSGDWAMRVYPVPSGTGELGYAKTIVPVIGDFGTLDFYAKWQKTATAAVSVEINYLINEAIAETAYWGAPVDTSEWALVSIPLDQEIVGLTHLEVIVSVQIGDFAPGEGWISVDDMGFGFINGIDENINSGKLILSPNPCDKHLNINPENIDFNSDMVIYDLTGHLIYIGKIDSIYDTSQLANGTYIFQTGEGSNLLKERFQVLH